MPIRTPFSKGSQRITCNLKTHLECKMLHLPKVSVYKDTIYLPKLRRRYAFYDIFLPDTTSFKFSLHKCRPASSRISCGVMAFTAFKASA